jgi:hypothetical protein
MMEALLLKSAAFESKPRVQKAVRPATAPNLAGMQAAAVRLPLCFVLTGLLSLLVSGCVLMAQPDLLAMYHYTPHLIAITHLFVLGFICSIVMGAMYQLVPVTLETQIFSERLVKFQFGAHIIGFVGMVWAFWNFNMACVGVFGSVLTLGVVLFVFNLACTLAKVKRWNTIKFGITSALLWLSATVAAGLFVTASKFWNFFAFQPVAAMHAHAHLGVVGVFVLMIVTVSYKLVPMFTLSELQNERRAWCSVALINIGLVGVFITVLFQEPFKPLFALVTISGFLLYGWEIVAILRARNRRVLDWGMKYFLTSIALLVPLAILALALSWSGLPVNAVAMQLESVYGLLGLLGLVGLAILGMLYKIVPFLVWFHSYSRHIGRARVPALADMYSVPLQIAGYWTFLAGLAGLCLATAWSHPVGIRWGGGLLVLSLAIFALNMGKILAHFVRPRVEPFAKRSNPAIKTL